jgi:hypothetical protein
MVPFLYPFARNHLLGMSTFFDGLGIKALGDANESSRPNADSRGWPLSGNENFKVTGTTSTISLKWKVACNSYRSTLLMVQVTGISAVSSIGCPFSVAGRSVPVVKAFTDAASNAG